MVSEPTHSLPGVAVAGGTHALLEPLLEGAAVLSFLPPSLPLPPPPAAAAAAPAVEETEAASVVDEATAALARVPLRWKKMLTPTETLQRGSERADPTQTQTQQALASLLRAQVRDPTQTQTQQALASLLRAQVRDLPATQHTLLRPPSVVAE